MKKLSIIFALFFGIAMTGFSQTAAPASDFFAGKWDILVTGSPRGDVIFKTNLIRQENKLTGELMSDGDKRPINKIEETATKLIIYFNSSQGGEISMDLDKVDDNNLKGYLMGYDVTAKRIKE